MKSESERRASPIVDGRVAAHGDVGQLVDREACGPETEVADVKGHGGVKLALDRPVIHKG